MPDSTCVISAQTSINAGSTWQDVTNGGAISGLTAGDSLSGKHLLIKMTLTASNADIVPVLNGVSVWVIGDYSASGTRSTGPYELDLFARANQSGWGTASNGDTYTTQGSGTFAISSNTGTITGNSQTHAQLGTKTGADQSVVVEFQVGNTATQVGAEARYTNSGGTVTCYRARLSSNVLTLDKRVSGTLTTITTASFTTSINTKYRIRLVCVGTMIEARVWASSGSEPTTWLVSATDSAIASGGAAVSSNVNSGDTAAVTFFEATSWPDARLSLTPVGRVGDALIAWNSNLPTNTSLILATSLDGLTWTNRSSGDPIAGITGQSIPVFDTFNTDTSASYTSAHRTGGSNGTWPFDTANSRVSVSGGTNAALLYTSASKKDVDVILDLDQAEQAGLVWRWQDASNFYELDIADASASSASNTMKLYKVVANVKTQLGSAVVISFTRGDPHRLRLTHIGTAITIYLDSTTSVISTTDSAITSAGQVGIFAGTGIGRFYNFRILAYGDDLTGQYAFTRATLTSTDPIATAQLQNLTLAALSPDIATGALMPDPDYRGKKINEVFDDLKSASTDWLWLVRPNKSLVARPRQADPALWILTGKDAMITDGPHVGKKGDNYCNRVVITGVDDGSGGTIVVTRDNIGGFPGTYSQSDFATLTGGGSGIVVRVEDGAGMSIAQAQIFGDGILQEFGVIGRTIQFKTERTGLKAGQYLPAIIPEMVLNDAALLVTNVKMSYWTSTTQTMQLDVEAVEGPNAGSWQKVVKSSLKSGATNSANSSESSAQELFLNVKDHGVIGNGITDETAIIQAIIDKVGNTGGGTVYFPSGVYVGANLQLYSRVHIIGAGIGATTIKLKNGANSDLFSANTSYINLSASINAGNTGGITQWSIQNMTIDGNKANQSSGPSYCMRYYGYGYYLNNLNIINGYSGGVLCDWNGGVNSPDYATYNLEAFISNVKVHDNNGICWQMGGPHDSMFKSCFFYDSGNHNFHLAPNAQAVLFSQCHFYSGPHLGDSCAMLCESSTNMFVGCEFEGGDYQAVILDNGNHLRGCRIFVAAGASYNGIKIGQQAGETPLSGQILQSAGVTTAVSVSGCIIDASINNCEGTHGSLWLDNDGGNDFRVDPYNATANYITGTRNTNSIFDVFGRGLTADGTLVKSSGTIKGGVIQRYGTVGLAKSSSVPVISNGGTIGTANTGMTRVSTSANVTGIILALGSFDGQISTVVNESANTITFDASGTSHVASGTGAVIAAQSSRLFVYDTSTSLWY